jgi:hypothetical protein
MTQNIGISKPEFFKSLDDENTTTIDLQMNDIQEKQLENMLIEILNESKADGIKALNITSNLRYDYIYVTIATNASIPDILGVAAYESYCFFIATNGKVIFT